MTKMVKLSDLNGAWHDIHPDEIREVVQPHATEAWHGCQAKVRLADGRWIEARETRQEIERMRLAAAQPEPTAELGGETIKTKRARA